MPRVTIHGTVDHDGRKPPASSISITHIRLCTPLYQPPVQHEIDILYESAGSLRFVILVEDRSEKCGRDDWNALEYPEVKQLSVTGNDVIGVPSNGALEEDVIIRISQYTEDAMFWYDELCKRSQACQYG